MKRTKLLTQSNPAQSNPIQSLDESDPCPTLTYTSAVYLAADRLRSKLATMYWNSLPESIRDPSLSLTVFTNRLKTYLFRQ